MKRVTAIVAAMMMSASANAADSEGVFHIVGAGAVTCQQYSTATPEQQLYAETWWAGYFTALNRTTPDTYNLMGAVQAAQVNEMLRRYCAANPTHRLAIAVHEVADQLHPGRARQPSR